MSLNMTCPFCGFDGNGNLFAIPKDNNEYDFICPKCKRDICNLTSLLSLPEYTEIVRSMKFKGIEYELFWGRYTNGRRALRLVDEHDSENIIYVTSNIPGEKIVEDEILVNSSGDDGILAALIAAGVIKDIRRSVNISVCRLCVTPPGMILSQESVDLANECEGVEKT